MYWALIVAIIVAGVLVATRKKKKSTGGTATTTAEAVKITGKTAEAVAVTYYVDGKKKEGTLKVAQGLQVFDSSGKIDLDITENLVKVIATVDVAGNGGSYSSDMLKNASIWWALLLPTGNQNIHVPTKIETSSGKITWSASSYINTSGSTVTTAVDSGVKLVVGVY